MAVERFEDTALAREIDELEAKTNAARIRVFELLRRAAPIVTPAEGPAVATVLAFVRDTPTAALVHEEGRWYVRYTVGLRLFAHVGATMTELADKLRSARSTSTTCPRHESTAQCDDLCSAWVRVR